MAPEKSFVKNNVTLAASCQSKNTLPMLKDLYEDGHQALTESLKSWDGVGTVHQQDSTELIKNTEEKPEFECCKFLLGPLSSPSLWHFISRNIFYLSEIFFWLQANHYEPFSESLNRALKGTNNYKNNSVTSAYILFYLVM